MKARIASQSRGMSNTAYHRAGKPTWWIRLGQGDDARFLDIGYGNRGDEPLAVTVDNLPDGIEKVAIGVGKMPGGIRETVTVERPRTWLLFATGPLTATGFEKATKVDGWKWDETVKPKPPTPHVYQVTKFESYVEAAAARDMACLYICAIEDAEREQDDSLAARLKRCKAEVKRLEGELAFARAALDHVEFETLEAMEAQGVTVVRSTDAQG